MMTKTHMEVQMENYDKLVTIHKQNKKPKLNLKFIFTNISKKHNNHSIDRTTSNIL